ncbi:hypothetical protein D3C71_354450 [compost metagenome]
MAPSILKIADLNPSLAIFPLRLIAGLDGGAVITRLASEIERLIRTDPKKDKDREDVDQIQLIGPETVGGWALVGVAYRVSKPASWIARSKDRLAEALAQGLVSPPADDDSSQDSVVEAFRQSNWHLVLLGAGYNSTAEGRFFVHATQAPIARQLREWVTAGRFGTLLTAAPVAYPFADQTLQDVCLSGPARQTALDGIHRIAKTKPDRKSLGGIDLREAIDPFADQTYRLLSAVSIDEAREPKFLGLALGEQRVWSQRGKRISHFTKTLDELFGHLEAAEAGAPLSSGLEQPGYASLARAAAPDAIHDARDAFEVALRPTTDLTAIDEETAETGLARERQIEIAWFTDGEVRLVSGDSRGPGLSFEVYKTGRKLMTLTLAPTPDADGVSLPVTSQLHVSPTDPDLELFEFLVQGNGLRERLSVWYDTGHVLTGGKVSHFDYVDVKFDAWTWDKSLAKYDVDQEKPMKVSATDPNRKVADLAAIGAAGGRSLFDYLVHDFPAHFSPTGDYWAICDDGAGEVADFVFFEPGARRLWLVHAKGAASTAAARRISVSAYEQVVSQARKNMRYLVGANLAAQLESKTYPTPRIWRNGKVVTAADHAAELTTLCQTLKTIKFFDDSRLVVLQPHVRKISWRNARSALVKGEDGVDVKAYRLLSALLADLQISAQKLNAGFMAIGYG